MVRIGYVWRLAALAASGQATWPNGPYVTEGQDIRDDIGAKFTYVGVNWPGHLDPMIPEGLQYQSIEFIVLKIKELGMNSIRLTWAVQMVDEMASNGGTDITIQQTFLDTLGRDRGAQVYQDVIKHNPSLAGATRLQVFDAVVETAAKHHILINLDNHVSTAGWCCNMWDKNGFFGAANFPVANWTRGLAFMADHGKQNWPSLLSMSLRNELRPSLGQVEYNWATWYKYMKQGADAVHHANPDVLILLGGLESATTLTPVVRGLPLAPGQEVFSLDDFVNYNNKIVLELHNYANTKSGLRSCETLSKSLLDAGFETLIQAGVEAPADSVKAVNKMPLVLTEFGFDPDNVDDMFSRCLTDFLPTHKAGWQVWVMAGSYYVRQGTQNYNETWGLLSPDWSDWRSHELINTRLIPLVKATYDATGTHAPDGPARSTPYSGGPPGFPPANTTVSGSRNDASRGPSSQLMANLVAVLYTLVLAL